MEIFSSAVRQIVCWSYFENGSLGYKAHLISKTCEIGSAVQRMRHKRHSVARCLGCKRRANHSSACRPSKMPSNSMSLGNEPVRYAAQMERTSRCIMSSLSGFAHTGGESQSHLSYEIVAISLINTPKENFLHIGKTCQEWNKALTGMIADLSVRSCVIY